MVTKKFSRLWRDLHSGSKSEWKTAAHRKLLRIQKQALHHAKVAGSLEDFVVSQIAPLGHHEAD